MGTIISRAPILVRAVDLQASGGKVGEDLPPGASLNPMAVHARVNATPPTSRMEVRHASFRIRSSFNLDSRSVFAVRLRWLRRLVLDRMERVAHDGCGAPGSRGRGSSRGVGPDARDQPGWGNYVGKDLSVAGCSGILSLASLRCAAPVFLPRNIRNQA